MAEFEQAVAFVLVAEGSDFVNDPADSGGATRWGISLRFLREIPQDRLNRYGIFSAPTPLDVELLTQEQAELVYHGEFWMHAPFGDLGSQPLANYVFSMCIWHGMGQGVKMLQRATWAVTGAYGSLADDGILGSDTLARVNTILASGSDRDTLVTALMAEQAGYCRLLARIRPTNREFLDGWLRRCYRI